MPYSRPTLTQLREQVMQDINSSPLGVNGFLRFAVLKILGWAQAAMAYLHYGYIDWISKQSVPWTASDEFLTGWAALVGVYQEDATFASGPVTFTGTQGSQILAGTIFNCKSNGLTYISTATATVDSTLTASVPMECQTAGSAGNLAAGTPMSLSSPISGIVSTSGVVGTAGIDGGSDQESPDNFRSRALEEYANPPQGGDRADYIEWMKAVNGVTRAWVAPHAAGAGTVVCYFMMDETEAANEGFPQGANGVSSAEPRDTAATGDQLEVANALFNEQPVTALVYSCAPIKTPVDFAITGLGADNTEAMQAAIKAALSEMFIQQANVGGTVNPDTGAAYGSIEPSVWFATLEAVSGLSQFSVPTPASSIMPTAGQLFVLGNCTFTS